MATAVFGSASEQLRMRFEIASRQAAYRDPTSSKRSPARPASIETMSDRLVAATKLPSRSDEKENAVATFFVACEIFHK
jgi:hypothetical protein